MNLPTTSELYESLPPIPDESLPPLPPETDGLTKEDLDTILVAAAATNADDMRAFAVAALQSGRYTWEEAKVIGEAGADWLAGFRPDMRTLRAMAGDLSVESPR